MAQEHSTEWKTHGLLVLAAAIGLSFNGLLAYTLGVFMEPLTSEFGWTRSEVTMGLFIPAIVAVPMSPLVGGIVDRWGSRRLAVPGLAICALVVAAFGLANGSIVQWLLLWALFATFGLLIKATVWTVAVSNAFTASRGLALGVALCGVAVAQVVGPPLTEWLIRAFGWRQAYFALGLGWGGLAFVMAVFFLFDSFDLRRRAKLADPGKPQHDPETPGLTLRQAVRNPAIIKIACSTLILMLLTAAVIIHQVPILTAVGLSRPEAAMLAGFSGLAGLLGKLVAGVLSDRWDARYVGAITLLAPAIAFFFLLERFQTPGLVIFSMLVLGYVTGVKLQICAYLTSRYSGMRSFGKIFGVMSSLITVASASGPALASLVFDLSGSYQPLFLASIPFSAVSAFLILTLGPYPEWHDDSPGETSGEGSRGPAPGAEGGP